MLDGATQEHRDRYGVDIDDMAVLVHVYEMIVLAVGRVYWLWDAALVDEQSPPEEARRKILSNAGTMTVENWLPLVTAHLLVAYTLDGLCRRMSHGTSSSSRPCTRR